MQRLARKGKLILALTLVLLGTGRLTVPAYAGDTQVFAFNDLGMHCMDNDFSTFAILPPFNVLHAQVILKAPRPIIPPRILTNFMVQVTYAAVANPAGSINTTSQGKTNFWTYAPKLFGALLPPDVGLLGVRMPGPANTPQPFTTYDRNMNWFTAPGIPITDRDDAGKTSYYSLMQVEALDLANAPLASLSTVVPVSTEMHCQECHATGSDGAFPGFHGVAVWSNKASINRQTRENILILHDAINNTTLMAQRPVLCSSCHYSFALDINKTGPTGAQVGKSFMSRAIHKHHSTLQTDPATSTSSIPIPDQGVGTCYSCHPGARTRCFRGAMFKAGLICQDCHGPMTAVAGIFPMTNGNIRQPWVDMPKCQSCHTGDAVKHVGQDLILRTAFDPADPAATPRQVPASRFAENTGKLFKESKGHSDVACLSCHNATHAEWTSNNFSDNLTARQIQGHAGFIIECRVCHNDTLPPTLSGPHGMHPVNHLPWVNGHASFFTAAPTSCKTCHGRNLAGTVLSKTGFNRKFNLAGGTVTIAKGVPVNCTMCHARPLAP